MNNYSYLRFLKLYGVDISVTMLLNCYVLIFLHFLLSYFFFYPLLIMLSFM